MPLYRERALVIAIKMEATSGTDSVPTAGANAIQMKGLPEITVDYLESGDRNDVQTGVLSGADDAAPAGRFVQWDMTVELRGTGNAYSNTNRPPEDPLWRISDMLATVDTTPGSENIKYTSIDNGGETATAYIWTIGKLFKVVGCKAAPKGQVNANQPGTVTFTVKGRLATDPTEVTAPSPTFTGATPPVFNSAATAIGSWNQGSTEPLMLLSASFDLGNEVPDLPSAGAFDGHAGYVVGNRNVTQEFQVFAPSLATMDFFAKSKLDGVSGAVVTAYQIGTTAYNKIKVEARWRPRAPRGGTRSSVKTFTVSGPCKVGSSGVSISSGREIQITYLA